MTEQSNDKGVEAPGPVLQDEVAAATADPSCRIGRYVVLSELGRGGMGVVHRCWDPSLQRLVALKLILDPDHAGPENLKRFQREGQVMARLSHPGIVQLLDVGDHNGQPFIALAFVDGKTFEDAYHHHRPSAQELAQVLAQVADALQHAHDHGVVHRDVKPGNVFIDRRGRAQLGDFGLVAVSDASTRLTRTGRAVGTPGYMAPEQLSNDLGEAGPHSDIYGLGGLLYWGLTGKDPFVGNSVTEVLRQVLLSDARPPREANPDTHPDLNHITLHCLSKKPKHRPATAADVAKDLRRVALGEKLKQRADQSRTPRFAVMVVGLIGIASAAGLIFGLPAENGTPPRSDTRQAHGLREPAQQDREVSPGIHDQAAADHATSSRGEEAAAPAALELLRRGREKLITKIRNREIFDAIADLTRAIEIEPQLTTAWLARGKAHSMNADYRAAIADLTRAIEIKPLLTTAWLARGKAHSMNADYRAAIADLTRATEIEPQLAEPWLELGKTRARLFQGKRAIAALSRAIDIDPYNPEAWGARGRQRMKAGDADGGNADFKRSKLLRLNSAAGQLQLGSSERAAGHYNSAIAAFERALELSPDMKLTRYHARAWLDRARNRLASGDINGSIADCTRAIEIDSDDTVAWNNRGTAKANKGDYDGAIADYTRAIEIKPEDGDFWRSRGLVRRDMGDYVSAITDLTRACEIEPNSVKTWTSLGNLRQRTGDLDGAIADYTRAIDCGPNIAAGWNGRGVARQAKGDLNGAIADLTRAINLMPDKEILWVNRGRAWHRKGDLDRAIADYSHVIDGNTSNPSAWNGRAVARDTKGDLNGAIEDFTRAIDINPNDAIIWLNRGGTRQRKGDLDGASADFEKFLVLAPNHPRAPYARGALQEVRLEQSKAKGLPGN